jgi:hypothetical protein
MSPSGIALWKMAKVWFAFELGLGLFRISSCMPKPFSRIISNSFIFCNQKDLQPTKASSSIAGDTRAENNDLYGSEEVQTEPSALLPEAHGFRSDSVVRELRESNVQQAHGSRGRRRCRSLTTHGAGGAEFHERD